MSAYFLRALPVQCKNTRASAEGASEKIGGFYEYFTKNSIKIAFKHAHEDALIKTCQNDALTNMHFSRALPHTIHNKMYASAEGASEKNLWIFTKNFGKIA